LVDFFLRARNEKILKFWMGFCHIVIIVDGYFSRGIARGEKGNLKFRSIVSVGTTLEDNKYIFVIL